MKDRLNNNQIDYVIFHLFHYLNLDESFKSYFHFNRNLDVSANLSKKIIFNQSVNPFEIRNVKWINDIPVLFACSEQDVFFSIEGNNLVFHHDILKSAFYFLSGYQELNPEYTDDFNRFPYYLSVQKKLNITKRPIVNYYFEIIKHAIQKFCDLNSINLTMPEKSTSFKFFLTHDVDVVDTYNFSDLIYYGKLMLGLAKNNLSYKNKIKKFWEYFWNTIFTNNNPNWDFEFLREIENDNHLKSAFFFLPKGVKHKDAYYSFNESRLIELFDFLKDEGCEIGIHGSVKSVKNLEVLRSNLSDLKKNSSNKVNGIRQHRLMYDMKMTPSIHESVNLLYDSTLGFAEHEGFRNSYCCQFKLYNFSEDRAYNTWEIPLNVMDATLFKYRGLNINEAFESINEIIDEIRKFNGIFTMLWHNGNFDETLYPGITEFYKNTIKHITSLQPECILGKDIQKIN